MTTIYGCEVRKKWEHQPSVAFSSPLLLARALRLYDNVDTIGILLSTDFAVKVWVYLTRSEIWACGLTVFCSVLNWQWGKSGWEKRCVKVVFPFFITTCYLVEARLPATSRCDLTVRVWSTESLQKRTLLWVKLPVCVLEEQENKCNWLTTSQLGSAAPAFSFLISEECLLVVIRPLIKLMEQPWVD